MRFSWKAVLLAPLPVPLVVALILAAAPNQDRLFLLSFSSPWGAFFLMA
jgi:hypothetical protein